MGTNKLLKIVVGAIILILFIAISFLGFVYFAPAPEYKTATISLQVQSTPERIAEGKRIALTLCNKCHYDEKTNTLTGCVVTTSEAFDDMFAPNITRDKKTGIGNYSDGELAYMLRTGINRDGHFVIEMPKYPLLSDEDMASIIAFFKSEDSLVRPIEKKIIPPPPNFLTKILLRTVFKPEKYPSAPIAHPDTNNLEIFGRYLATAKFVCFACHSKLDIVDMPWTHPESSKNYFKGGARLMDNEHRIIYSANISSDKKNGIGRWSEQQFITTIKTGIKPDGKAVRNPMFPFYLLSDKEASAIYKYLMSIKTTDK